MGTFPLPNGQQMVAGLPVGRLNSLENRIAAIEKNGGGGGSANIYSETPAGAIDGSNTSYTVSNSISAILAFAINGQFIHPAAYTFSGIGITFIVPPDASLAGTPFTIIYTSGTTPPASSGLGTEGGDAFITEGGDSIVI